MSILLFDALSKVMISLIGVVGAMVIAFSYRYMSFEQRYYLFFARIGMLLVSVGLLVCANYLPLFFVAWVSSNLLLVQLIKTNDAWSAAVESSRRAMRSFMLGFLCMGIAFSIIGYLSSSYFISEIAFVPHWLSILALGLLLVTAMIQSAIWPFNSWLLSSLNSPTPVSAFMHAGLVNGGGFLIVRFAHLYVQVPMLLYVMLALGIASALAGIFFKLIQTDVKRMLACSTMAQMGFVLVQCGSGLFSAAIAHLCWHGVFKAYLFLSSSTVEYTQHKSVSKMSLQLFMGAVLIGFLGMMVFAYGHSFMFYNSTALVLLTVAGIASTQMALTMLQSTQAFSVVIATLCATLLAWFYAVIDMSLEHVLSKSLVAVYPLSSIHVIIIAALVISWICMVFSSQLARVPVLYRLFVRLYVWAVRASMPDHKTVTVDRGNYRYK